MPTDIKSSEDLLRRLSKAAHGELTRDQLFRQRVSLIYGSLPKDSTITRHQIEQALHKSEGKAA